MAVVGSGPPHERDERAGEQEGGVDVHLDELLPSLGRVVLDGPEVPEEGGVVHEPVEAVELSLHPGRERLVVGGHRAGEVHRVDGGLRAARGPYRVIGPFELLDGAPEQHHGRGMGRAGARDRASDAVAGSGDEDRAPFEEVRFGAEFSKAGIELHGVRAPWVQSGWRPRPEGVGESSAGRRYQAR